MMKVNLLGQTALVTGSAKGLGAAIAKALARAGARVIVHYRTSRKEAEKTLKWVRQFSPESFLVSGDLTKEAKVKRMFGQIDERLDSIDILINLVGNFIYKPLNETSFRELKDVWESNIYPMWLCTQAVIPKMRQHRQGYIINFGSSGCERILLRPKTTPYYLAKTGVYMLTKVMAAEEAKYGIRINMISPGVLPTSQVKPKNFPAGRLAQFADIINAVFFLLSAKASYIIGANIEVAGGWSPELYR